MTPVGTVNKRHSSVVVPISSCSPAPAAAAMESIGRSWRISPSITGSNSIPLMATSPQRPGSGFLTRARSSSACASTKRSTGTAATASALCGTPSSSQNIALIRFAVPVEITWWPAPLQDGSPEQAGRLADGEQRRHAEGARRLTEDGDVAGVAAEGADVFLDPAQRRQLVEQPQVGHPIVEPEEAFRPQPIVDRDADDPVSGKAAAVIDRDGARASQEGAAAEPYHYRQAARAGLGRPDIQVEVVFAARAGVTQHVPERFGIGRLGGNGSILVRRSHAAPPFGWLGRPKAVGAEWRGGVGNPFE